MCDHHSLAIIGQQLILGPKLPKPPNLVKQRAHFEILLQHFKKYNPCRLQCGIQKLVLHLRSGIDSGNAQSANLSQSRCKNNVMKLTLYVCALSEMSKNKNHVRQRKRKNESNRNKKSKQSPPNFLSTIALSNMSLPKWSLK